MSAREQIRQATLGGKKQFKSKIYDKLDEPIEIRQPSVGARREMLKRSAVNGNMQQIDGAAMMVWGIIGCCYVPDTDEKVFDDGDFDTLESEPSDGWVDDLGECVSELMGDPGKGGTPIPSGD